MKQIVFKMPVYYKWTKYPTIKDKIFGKNTDKSLWSLDRQGFLKYYTKYIIPKSENYLSVS